MTTESSYTEISDQPSEPRVTPAARLPRLWPAFVLLGIFWIIYSIHHYTDVGLTLGFMGYLILLGIGALTILLFVVWWLAFSRVGIAERWLVLAVAVAAGSGMVMLSDKSVQPLLQMPGPLLVLTAWTLGLFAVRKWPAWPRAAVLAGVLCLSCAAFTLLRSDGVSGGFQLALRWRWSPTPEQIYLATLQPTGTTAAPSAVRSGLRGQPGDWPGFRGPDRNATLRDVRLATNWDTAPPQLVWKRPIGPAWSSIIFVGDRLFTQEQLGTQEAVVCLDAATGRTLWSHLDTARHDDAIAGAGPRATPTFIDGHLFTLGATGILNCLKAETGERQWYRDIAADAGVKTPIWGFASSPLVARDLVIVFAGGESDKTLLAYRSDSGKLAWSASAGKISYSSPQLALIGGTTQILFVSDRGLLAFDPSSGNALWEHPTPPGNPGQPRSIQPRVVESQGILFDAGADLGTGLLQVARSDASWTASQRWLSRQWNPSFNDFVVHDQSLYGFDGRVFSCLDLKTGQRRWKKGRYGSGQVLLLSDQSLLLVVTEDGEVVLVAADPNEHRELGRFQALEGKTWGHPALVRSRLYLRNAEEIACYEVRTEKSR